MGGSICAGVSPGASRRDGAISLLSQPLPRAASPLSPPPGNLDQQQRGRRRPQVSLHLPRLLALPAAPAPTFAHVAPRMGLGRHFVSARSRERQPHAASSVSQAFKLPFYLNLCPRIQAEKGPFQNQFLLYGFMGDRIGQLLNTACCSQHDSDHVGGTGSGSWGGHSALTREPCCRPSPFSLQTQP